MREEKYKKYRKPLYIAILNHKPFHKNCKNLGNLDVIASASATKVKLWSIDGILLTSFGRFGSNDVSFSPDGKSIAAAGENGFFVWNFDLNKLLKRGCDAARDYLKNNPKAKSDRHCERLSARGARTRVR